MFGKNQNWNNRRESYIKPPDPEHAERKKTLFEIMKETVSKNKESTPQEPGKLTLTEIAQQKHYDLDASIAEEVQKRTPVLPPLPKTKFNPITIPAEALSEEPEGLEVPDPEPVTQKIHNGETVFDCIGSMDTVIEFFSNANADMILFQNNVHQADVETSDLLHSIELTDFEDEEKLSMTDKMKEVRMRRRKFKQLLEYFIELDLFVKGNQRFIEDLKSLKEKLDRIKEKHEHAMYRPRIRTDLKPNEKIRSV